MVNTSRGTVGRMEAMISTGKVLYKILDGVFTFIVLVSRPEEALEKVDEELKKRGGEGEERKGKCTVAMRTNNKREL